MKNSYQLIFPFLLLLVTAFRVFAQDPEPQFAGTETRPIKNQVRQTVEFREDRVYFSNEFEGARLNRVERDADGNYVVTILPENEPINMSPWYAFKVWSTKGREITVKLVYPEFARHRYDPKISRDGRTWATLERSRITDIEPGEGTTGARSRPKSVILRLSVTNKPLWVSAQELQTSKHVFEWMDTLAKQGGYPINEIGKSREGRPLRLMTIGNADARNKMLVISRQHPPEVTGYFAMQAFVERIGESTELSEEFRRNWAIYVVPLMNPDGVDEGHWRHNAGGIDLNRDWSDFNQPETTAVRDFLRRMTEEEGGRFIFGIDFHSTWFDVYYPLSPIFEGNAPRIMNRWLENIQAAIPDYQPRIEPNARLLPTRIGRNHFFDEYGMEAVVYEIGDNTPRDFIRAKGVTAADKIMKLLLDYTKRP
jgi:cytosolic carboxypeptidase protein 6